MARQTRSLLDPAILKRHGKKITDLIESGVIRPLVDKVFDFQATNEALAYVEAGRTKGKVVIVVKQQPGR